MLNLIVKILSNIINHPNQSKYRDISFNRISKKLGNNDKYINLLFQAGFKLNKHSRLILDRNDLIKAQNMHTQILYHEQIKELTTAGFTIQESFAAIHLSLQPQNQTPTTEHGINLMINMGFNQNQCINALHLSSGNVTAAINLLADNSNKSDLMSNSNDCNKLTKNCAHINQIIDILKQYNNKFDLDHVHEQQLIGIVNNFNHVLFHHNSNNDFKYILEHSPKCDIQSCDIMRRHHTDRFTSDINECKQSYPAGNINVYYKMIDKMHCYFMHSMDIGCRLQSNGGPLKAYSEYADIVSLNKFKQMQTSIVQYNFGQLFYYWSSFKNNENGDLFCNIGYKQGEWYINSRYNSFKQELLNNDIQTISKCSWQKEYDKAVKYEKTDYAKLLLADAGGGMYDTFLINVDIFDIIQGSSIKVHHLISIIIYCGYTELATKFTETYRRLNQTLPITENDIQGIEQMLRLYQFSSKNIKNIHIDLDKETDYAFKQRHSNFYHLAKYITEAINVFSQQAVESNTIRFYHGINQQMKFNSMHCMMYQPFSTTKSRDIALTFSNKLGVILQINCHPLTRYFDCRWLSPYPYEDELLFLMTFSKRRLPLTFKNITNTVNGKHYEIYIESLSIIDSFVSGNAFESDSSSFYKLIKYFQTSNYYNTTIDKRTYQHLLNSCGVKGIPPTVKLLTIQLIKHQLNKSEPLKYDRIINIDQYVETLLNCICLDKFRISINMELINHDILEYIRPHGYQGYFFFKYLFCENDCDVIKMNLISTLFPNAKYIKLLNLTSISSLFLEYILEYLPKISKNVQYISLHLKEKKYNQSIEQLIKSYQRRFLYTGCWVIQYRNSIVYIFRLFACSNAQQFGNAWDVFMQMLPKLAK